MKLLNPEYFENGKQIFDGAIEMCSEERVAILAMAMSIAIYTKENIDASTKDAPADFRTMFDERGTSIEEVTAKFKICLEITIDTLGKMAGAAQAFLDFKNKNAANLH